MTDADTVRVAALFHYDMTGNRDALSALYRLEAERDRIAHNLRIEMEIGERWRKERLAAEAERDRLRAALERIAELGPAHRLHADLIAREALGGG